MIPKSEQPKRFADWKVKVPEKNSKKKTIIITAAISIIIVLLLAAVIFFWTNKGKDEKNLKMEEITTEVNPPLPTKPEIKDVQLEPQKPTSQDFIHVQAALEHPDMQFVKFSYQWYVNGNAITASEAKTNVLDRKYFKKGDDVYCRVKAKRGNVEAEPVDSDSVHIENSPPMLNLSPVKPFDVPGEFRYTINAEDPDDDPLTYQLLEPRDRGIVIDRNTGLLKWYITAPPQNEEQPQLRPEDENNSAEINLEPRTDNDSSITPNFITIIFEVKDNDDASVKGSINLNLTRGSEIPK